MHELSSADLVDVVGFRWQCPTGCFLRCPPRGAWPLTALGGGMEPVGYWLESAGRLRQQFTNLKESLLRSLKCNLIVSINVFRKEGAPLQIIYSVWVQDKIDDEVVFDLSVSQGSGLFELTCLVALDSGGDLATASVAPLPVGSSEAQIEAWLQEVERRARSFLAEAELSVRQELLRAHLRSG